MYQNIIFDLYGTLVDIKTNENSNLLWNQLAKIYSTFGARYHGSEIRKSYQRLCSEEEKKYDSPNCEICLDHVFRNLFVEKGVLVEDSLVWYVGNTFRALSRSRLKVYPGITDLLTALKKNGQKIYLLSNAQRIFTWQELTQCGLIPYFDGIFISSDHAIKKPDPNYMKLLLQTYSLNISDCIMVGNEIKSDIKIANAVGMDSLYIRTAEYEPLPAKVPATFQILDGNINKMSFYLIP